LAWWWEKHSRRNANAVNAPVANACVANATKTKNACVANAVVNGVSAENAGAVASGRAGPSLADSVEAEVEAVFRAAPPVAQVVPVDSEALRVVEAVFYGCSPSWSLSTQTVTARFPPRKSRQPPLRSRS